MKNQLTITSQSLHGGKNNNREGGYGLLTYKKDGGEIFSVSVDLFEGAGATYKERESAKIEIYFPSITGEFRFYGTADELKNKLFNL